MEDALPLIIVVIYLVGIPLSIALTLSPLFIWHHVAKMRQEMRDKLSGAVDALSEQVMELRAANAHLVEMQQRHAQTMQNVCDQLADARGNAKGSPRGNRDGQPPMVERSVKMLLAIAVAGFSVLSVFAHGDRFAHAADMQKVFDGYQDEDLRQFYAEFSSCIDTGPNSVEKRIRRRLAERFPGQVIKLTKHRYVAHSWFYGGSIPDLTKLEREYPGCKEVIIDVWRKFCNESNSWIEREFKLPRKSKIASAYCAMLYYTHLLGDWDPRDNSDFDYLMPPKEIVVHLVQACRDMFGRSSHSDYCTRFKSELEKALKSKVARKDQGVAVMKALWSLKVGTELHNTFAGRGLDESKHRWEPVAEPKEEK